jgi:hypothetical protein
MKKFVLGILAACLLLSSCSKDDTPKPTDLKHEVKFTVSPFSQEITDISYAKSLSTSIGYLEYIVYNSNGVKVNRISQTSADANFGVISDQLISGTYTIIILGTKDAPNICDDTNTDCANVYGKTCDSFYKQLTITVDKENISQNIVLDRIVSYLETVITDAIPSNAKKIVLNVENECGSFFLLEGGQPGRKGFVNIEKNVGTADVGTTNFTLGSFVLNTIDPLIVNIRAYDADNKVIAAKKVSNVTCVKNKKIILKGKLFDGITTPPSQSFSITVNDTFLDPTTITF